MKNMNLALISIVAMAGCGKSKGADAVACDVKALTTLSADLDKANGAHLDLTKDSVKADTAAAAKAITGKKYAFTGCSFFGQGNDAVSFSPAGAETPYIDCKMKGGQDAVTEFRHAAMKIGQAKLKLDVNAVVASAGDKDSARLQLTECEISAHD